MKSRARRRPSGGRLRSRIIPRGVGGAQTAAVREGLHEESTLACVICEFVDMTIEVGQRLQRPHDFAMEQLRRSGRERPFVRNAVLAASTADPLQRSIASLSLETVAALE